MMSWVRAISFSGEDVFDENADDINLLTREWTTNMKKRMRDGYVDGCDAGEEASLQVGFNQGYREGAAQTVAMGRLKGIVSAVCCWCQIQHPENPVPASVTDLLQGVSQYEEKIMNGIREALENPPPSVTSVTESFEVLDVERADSDCCGGGEGCKETDCCRGGEKMDLDAPQQQPNTRSGSTDCSSSSSESLNHLVQRCMDLVSELGLPQELIGHIQELKNM